MNIDDILPNKRGKIDEYLSLLFRLSKKINLTSFKDKEEVMEKGIVPLFSIIKYFKGGNCLDIGSGSGIPAIPLSILAEETKWKLLEPSSKKAGFLVETALVLNLPLTVETVRAEDFFRQKNDLFDIITIRGVKLNPKIVLGVKAHLEKEGYFIIFTGFKKKDFYSRLLKDCGFEIENVIESRFSVILVNVPRGTI